MLDLYQTPVDIFYFTLTVCVGLLTLFLIMALYHFIRILSDTRRITDKMKDTMDLVNHYLWQPIKVMMMIIEKGKEYASKRKSKH